MAEASEDEAAQSQPTDRPTTASASPSEGTSSAARSAGLTTTVVVMVLFIRIMAVSGWNWNTAAELADSFDFGDTVPIFLGTLFELPSVTGIAAAIILPLACYRTYLKYQRDDGRGAAADWLLVIMLGIVLFVLGRTYGSWWPSIVAVVWGALLAVYVLRVHKGGTLTFLQSLARRSGLLVGICFLALSILVATPWNPKEEIALIDGTTLVGHVIETQPGFVIVLTEDREVRTLVTDLVISRTTIDIPEDDATD